MNASTGAPVLAFITFGYVMLSSDFPDFIIAVVIGAGAFALEGAFVNWRGRGMFDPPGQVRKRPSEPEPEPKPGKADDREIYVHDDD